MGDIVLAGSTSGTTTLTPTAVSGTTTLTLPATTDTLVGKTTTDTLTNKTLGAGTVLPAGSIIQVTQTAANTFTYAGTTNTYTEISSSLRASITPSSASNKIIYSISGGRLSYTSAPCSYSIEIRRSTNGGSTFPTTCHKFADGLYMPTDSFGFSISSQFMDEPATTSSCMYSLFVSVTTGTSNIEAGSSAGDKTKIILMEVKG